MNPDQLINQTSGDDEYFTPGFIIAAARRVLDWIDLDPASCAQANKVVGAKRFYTREQDGLKSQWIGRVWMNHPFGRESNPLWIRKLLEAHGRQEVPAAICITYACTSESWFKMLLHYPQCFLQPRTNYLTPDGKIKKGVTKGSVVTYLGREWDKFAREFSPLGVVKVRYP